MANKALVTRQKMRMRLEPSQRSTPARNPVLLANGARFAATLPKTVRARRRKASRASAKIRSKHS